MTPPNPNKKTETKDGKPVVEVKQPHGGSLRRGNPDGPGRPKGYPFADREAFKERCEGLAYKVVWEGVAGEILDNPAHPHFMKMLEFVAERGMGKVPTEIKAELTTPPAIVVPAKEPLLIDNGEQANSSPDFESPAIPDATGTPE
jgi:hypothetical protein